MTGAARVIVTGVGFVSSIGNNQDEVFASLENGRSGIAIHPELEAAKAPVQLAGVIRGFDFPSENPQSWRWPGGVELSRQELRSLPPHGVYAHAALKEALAQAGLTPEMVRNEETGLLTASVGSTRLTYKHVQRLLEHGANHCHPFILTSSIAGTLNFNLAASLGIRGASGGCVSACASSAQAIGLAFDQIRMGRQRRMIVVGAEDCDLYSILPFATFHSLTKSRDPSESPCAFDRRRDGFAASGGAAVVILEAFDLAVGRGAEPLAEMVSWGWTSDGFDPMCPEPQGEGIERAMRVALEQSGLRPDDIDYVNAHASSTQAGDRAEARALTRLFGNTKTSISSTKSQTGHALSMAGALEAALCVLALQRRLIPANLNLRDPDPAAESLRLPREPEHAELRHLLSNSSGFGGVNVSLLFRASGSNSSALS